MRQSLRDAHGLASKTNLSFDHSSISTHELTKRAAYLVDRIAQLRVGIAHDALLDEFFAITDELDKRGAIELK